MYGSGLYHTPLGQGTPNVSNYVQDCDSNTVPNTFPTPINPSGRDVETPTQNFNYPQHSIPQNPGLSQSNNDVISLSTSFHPNVDPAPDTIFSSIDNVFFYTSYSKIISAAPNAFETYLGSSLGHPNFRKMVITLDAPSAELNVILHAVYDTSPEANSPDFQTLVKAVDRMPKYDIPAEMVVSSSSPLYKLLLAHAPLHPLDTYALAAHHRIYSLASTVSGHLLSHDLSTVSDAMAERIGPVYLMRLCMLHSERFNALKEILLHPPLPHPATRECGFEDQKKVARAWALVSAYLVWDAKPDISTYALTQTLNPIVEHLTCKYCERLLQERIRDVIVRWTSVQRTI